MQLSLHTVKKVWFLKGFYGFPEVEGFLTC